jgi:pimeloyl-ACP methyl ester carboxylesterase
MLSMPIFAGAKRFIAKSQRLSGLVLRGLVAPAHLSDKATRSILLNDEAKPRILKGLYHNRHYRNRFIENAKSVSQPVTIIAGGWDHIAPVGDSQELSVLLPSASVVVFADAGHAIPIESAVQLASTVSRKSKKGGLVYRGSQSPLAENEISQ